jgi:hypothetical protein
LPELPEHAELEPVIAPGVEGTEFSVRASELDADVPHAFDAVTVMFPEVEPKVTVALVVP